jgi:hypothetical protein
MASYNDIRANAEKQQLQQETPTATNQLTAPELAALLQIVRQATFVGEQVEVVYNMVMKLQNQYIEQTKK